VAGSRDRAGLGGRQQLAQVRLVDRHDRIAPGTGPLDLLGQLASLLRVGRPAQLTAAPVADLTEPLGPPRPARQGRAGQLVIGDRVVAEG